MRSVSRRGILAGHGVLLLLEQLRAAGEHAGLLLQALLLLPPRFQFGLFLFQLGLQIDPAIAMQPALGADAGFAGLALLLLQRGDRPVERCWPAAPAVPGPGRPVRLRSAVEPGFSSAAGVRLSS